MSRHALNGIGQVIKANTTEKSIDDLRAEGKKRVRVVSSARVMAIIQAIVDDTIASEVGEITKRDRDRIVSDTQDRFSRVLRMQQGLEQDVDDLRASLRSSEVERERLRADNTLLESQVESARRTDGEESAVERIGRELARVRESVERTSREPAVVDEATISRVAEKLAARDTQSARRLGTEFDDLRARLDSAARDANAARDAAMEKLLQRVKEQQPAADPQLAARFDREFRTVADQLAKLRDEVARGPAASDDVARMRGNFDALEKRIQGVERSSSELAERVSKAVLDRLDQREALAGSRRPETPSLDASQVTEPLRRLEHASDEGRQSVLVAMAALRESVDDARTRAVGAQAEQLRDLEKRIAEGASARSEVLARTVERLAERTAAIDGALAGLRGDLAGVGERVTSALDTTALVETLRRAERAAEEGRQSLVFELGALRESTADARTRAASSESERMRDLEQRIALSAAESNGALAGSVDRLAERTSSIDEALQVMRGHLAEVGERVATALDATPVTETLRRLERSADEGRQSLVAELGALRETSAEARTRASLADADRMRDLELRITGTVSETNGALARTVEKLAERTAAIDAALAGLRGDLSGAVERAAAANATAPAEVTEALAGLRSHAAEAAAVAGRTAEVQAALAARLDGSFSEMRAEVMALKTRSVEAAELQESAVRSLREQIAKSAAGQSEALQTSFKGALDLALDKITRTMQAATARPIEIHGEATDVLLARIFDGKEGEVTSNLDQLDVEQRRSKRSISKDVGRLKEMHRPAKVATDQPK